MAGIAEAVMSWFVFLSIFFWTIGFTCLALVVLIWIEIYKVENGDDE